MTIRGMLLGPSHGITSALNHVQRVARGLRYQPRSFPLLVAGSIICIVPVMHSGAKRLSPRNLEKRYVGGTLAFVTREAGERQV